ncbi:MAG: hypothetical protein ACQKBU_08495 [Verrucomicrobiales bacterium]
MSAGIDFADCLRRDQNLSYPDWEKVAARIAAETSQGEFDSRKAWATATNQWLETLSAELGPHYQVIHRGHFSILTSATDHVAAEIHASSEHILRQILHHLQGAVMDQSHGRHVALIFDQDADYYRYIARFFPDGELPMSGGLCLKDTVVHYAFSSFEKQSDRSVLAHELTHACLSHLPLPAWLDEALAMRMETTVTGDQIFYLDRERYEAHLRYWNADRIQAFWSGDSWTLPGEPFELSYSLAEILWRKIEVDLQASHPQVIDFIRHAHRHDAGASAFEQTFGLSLDELVEDFLGEGSWTPQGTKSGLTDHPQERSEHAHRSRHRIRCMG